MKLLIVKILLIAIISIILQVSSASSQPDDDLSPVYFIEIEESKYLPQHDKKSHFETDFFDRKRLMLNLGNDSGLKGLIDLRIRENRFYNNPTETIDLKTDFSKEINEFLDFNAGIFLEDLNNYTDNAPKITELNVSIGIIPRHRLYVGQTGIYTGPTSLTSFNTIENRHGANKFNTIEDIDLKIARESGFLNYAAGSYNIAGESPLAGGWASVNPFFGLKNSQNLKVGGGYFTNRHSAESILNREDAYSLFSEYKYDRFSIMGEFLRQDNILSEGAFADTLRFSKKMNITQNLQLEFNTSFIRDQEQKSRNKQRFGIFTRFFF